MQLKWLHTTAARAIQACRIVYGVLAITALCASVAVAGAPPQGTPEINPSYATSAITLLAGGMLLLRSKVRR